MKRNVKIETELAALRRELDARVREHAGAMSTLERAVYVAALPSEEQKLFQKIVGSTPPRPDADPRFAELDRAWGLGAALPAVTRTRFQLTASALGATPSRNTLQPSAAGSRHQSTLYPRSSPVGSITALSAAADAMDAAMGFVPRQHGARRTPNALVLSVFDDRSGDYRNGQ